jgi:hypothetical protein
MLYLKGGEKMEAIKIIEDVTSDSITIKNLSRYKGQKIEIIILPIEEGQNPVVLKPEKKKSAYGYLHKYAQPALIEKEKEAWTIAVKEKYGTS